MSNDTTGEALAELVAAHDYLNSHSGEPISKTMGRLNAAWSAARSALGGAATRAPADMRAVTDDLEAVFSAECAIQENPGTTLAIIRRLQAQLKEAKSATPAAVPVQPAKADSAAVQQGREALSDEEMADCGLLSELDDDLAPTPQARWTSEELDAARKRADEYTDWFLGTPQAPQPTEQNDSAAELVKIVLNDCGFHVWHDDGNTLLGTRAPDEGTRYYKHFMDAADWLVEHGYADWDASGRTEYLVSHDKPKSAAASLLPAQAPAVPLTDEQTQAIFHLYCGKNENGVPYLRCYIEGFQNIARAIEAAHGIGSASTSEPAQAQDFDAWYVNPYTKVLLKSIAEDYVPRHDATSAMSALVEMGKQKCFACDCGISDEVWDRARTLASAKENS